MAGGVNDAMKIVRTVIEYVSELIAFFEGDVHEVEKHIKSLRADIEERRRQRDAELAEKHGRE